jgi:hypothetical protein
MLYPWQRVVAHARLWGAVPGDYIDNLFSRFSLFCLRALMPVLYAAADDDDVFYLFLQKQKIGGKLQIYISRTH